MASRRSSLLLLAALILGYLGGHAVSAPAVAASNSVAAFFSHAERQAETDDQRREIQRALRDMLGKTPAELRQLRYADYEGKPQAWSVTELLQRYFVPRPPMKLSEERFYKDVTAPNARAAIRRQLDAVTRALQ
jgi:hypothetical protein